MDIDFLMTLLLYSRFELRLFLEQLDLSPLFTLQPLSALWTKILLLWDRVNHPVEIISMLLQKSEEYILSDPDIRY
jgi:hypothetical protein